MSDKVVSFDELIVYCRKNKEAGKKIVHTHGGVDILHMGYIKHLQQAKDAGDLLVITISPTRFSEGIKHQQQTSATLCAETLAALECVNRVAICTEGSFKDIVRALQPDKYAYESKSVITTDTDKNPVINTLQNELAVELVRTKSEDYKDLHYINRYMDLFTPEGKDYLSQLSSRKTVNDFKQLFEKLQTMKVLIIGEAIIDEYQFCQTMNKANKEPILAVRMLHNETYAGGALAIANHISGFCQEVGIVTGIGNDTYLSFIEDSLADNIKRHFLMRKNSPTLVKRRFVEDYLSQKLFETYLMENELLSQEEENELNSMLDNIIADYDIVIVADYGHGLMTESIIEKVCSKAKFLAVNAQTNAGNKGFNHISKYPKANYVSIDAPEARQEVRNQSADIEDIMTQIISKINCPRLTVTRGKLGCTILEREAGFTNVPAFALKMVDRIGAGDAFLTFSSCFTAMGCDADLTGFIGNVAGAEACATMGNKESITPESMITHIATLLN